MSVKPAPPSEEIDEVQPGVPVDMGSERGNSPTDTGTGHAPRGEDPAAAADEEPPIGDEPPADDDPYYDDPTGGASMDDADAETVMEVGLPVIERVFNVTHFEEITEEE